MFQKFQVTIHHYFQIKILINLSNGFSNVVQKVKGKYRITIVGTIVGFLEVLKS